MEELTVVIQAGGESKRMGTPKALVPFCGLPLICRSLSRLESVADELIITSNDPDSLHFVCVDKQNDERLKIYRDVYDVRGALNGLYTALYYATSPFVAIVACDMIFPSAPLLLAERDALIAEGADAAVPRTSHGFEPFHAVYRRETCLPAIKAALDRGETKANSWYDDVKLIEFTSEMVLEADPRGGAFINVNTPDELAAVESRIMSGEITKLSDVYVS
jgi:molybdopterin-guanine dinucleotide biosynthesis protein A